MKIFTVGSKSFVTSFQFAGIPGIITETPKLKKFKNKILYNISKLSGVAKERINIKAKTTEKLGVIGQEKAIATEVIISVFKYD